ncbi:MAG: hypothetical protein K8T10_03405 [Candidatus Eremiobacteraeota bacterium]|nr:hypothetical protein [Candidatus Eremiobacteraeota bacterium]
MSGNKKIIIFFIVIVICLFGFVMWRMNVTRTKEPGKPVLVDKTESPDENEGSDYTTTSLKRICNAWTKPENMETSQYSISPDCRRVAYFLKGDDVESAVVDGKKGKEYDVNPIIAKVGFSPDSKRVAYIAQKGNNKIAVVDGKEGKEYKRIFRDAVTFSPNSKRTAYVVKKKDKEVAVIDGKEGRDFYFILKGYVFFSPDSKNTAYCADKEKLWHKRRVLVMNGKEKWDKGISVVRGRFFFSPDSKRLAYMVRKGTIMYALVDGKKQKKFEASPFLDENSILDWNSFLMKTSGRYNTKTKRLWKYLNRESKEIISNWEPGQSLDKKSKSIIISRLNEVIKKKDFYEPKVFFDVELDEKYRDILSFGLALKPMPKLKEYFLNRLMLEAIFPKEIEKNRVYYSKYNMTFSPDSKHIAYEARSGRKWVMMFDGKSGKIYDDIGPPGFSPDSRHLYYIATEGKKQFLVVDGVEGKKYDSIDSTPRYSPDSRHIAYSATENGKQFMVLDGKEGEKHDCILMNLTVFRTDSMQNHYRAITEKDSVKKINEWKKMGRVRTTTREVIAFSADGKHSAYAARDGNKEFVVIDAKEGKKYDKIVLPPVFSPDGSTTAYAARDEGMEFVVINGHRMKKFNSIINGGEGRIVFDSSDELHYLALKDNDIYLIEEKIKKDVNETTGEDNRKE